ncbi:MAG: cation:proton antiporter regulatory subunit [Methanomicrobiales archaeon]
MPLQTLDLPGIGTRYELDSDKGDTVSAIYMKSGAVQLYVLPRGAEEPCMAELNRTEARRLGAVLTGALMESEPEGVEIAFSALADLRISVHTYPVPRRLVGACIGDLRIRTRTGATIIAISRQKGEDVTINPPPDYVFSRGDALVAIGEHDQLKRFEKEFIEA